jgi:hypothetical protein
VVLESDLQPTIGSCAKFIPHVHRQADGSSRRSTGGHDLRLVVDITDGSDDPGSADTRHFSFRPTGSANTGHLSCWSTGPANTVSLTRSLHRSASSRIVELRLGN